MISKTVYSKCLRFLCLTQDDAALLHNVSKHTINSYSRGERKVPAKVWDDLKKYYAEQVAGAKEITEGMENWESHRAKEFIESVANGEPEPGLLQVLVILSNKFSLGE